MNYCQNSLKWLAGQPSSHHHLTSQTLESTSMPGSKSKSTSIPKSKPTWIPKSKPTCTPQSKPSSAPDATSAPAPASGPVHFPMPVPLLQTMSTPMPKFLPEPKDRVTISGAVLKHTGLGPPGGNCVKVFWRLTYLSKKTFLSERRSPVEVTNWEQLFGIHCIIGTLFNG